MDYRKLLQPEDAELSATDTKMDLKTTFCVNYQINYFLKMSLKIWISCFENPIMKCSPADSCEVAC